MKHLPSTAEKYYRQLIQNDKDSLETSNMVASILKQNNEPKETIVEHCEMDIVDIQSDALIILSDENYCNSDEQMQASNPNDENTGHSDEYKQEFNPNDENTGHSDEYKQKFNPNDENTGHSDEYKQEFNPHYNNTGNSDEYKQEFNPNDDNTGHSDEYTQKLNPNENKEGEERSNSWIQQVLKDSGRGQFYFTIEDRKKKFMPSFSFCRKMKFQRKKQIDQIINDVLYDLMPDVRTFEKKKKLRLSR